MKQDKKVSSTTKPASVTIHWCCDSKSVSMGKLVQKKTTRDIKKEQNCYQRPLLVYPSYHKTVFTLLQNCASTQSSLNPSRILEWESEWRIIWAGNLAWMFRANRVIAKPVNRQESYLNQLTPKTSPSKRSLDSSYVHFILDPDHWLGSSCCMISSQK